MNSVFDFMNAALPWITMGLVLVIFFVRNADRKKDTDTQRKKDHLTEGMAIGMCLGTAIGTAMRINIGIAMVVGMLLGMLVGSASEKKEDE